MIGYEWRDLGTLTKGQTIKIDLVGNEISVKLLTYDNFTPYRFGLPYRYHGGRALKTPCHIQVPHDGSWILVFESLWRFKFSFQISDGIGLDKTSTKINASKNDVESKTDNTIFILAEGKTDPILLNKAIQKLGIECKWDIKQINEGGDNEGGESELRKAFDIMRKNPHVAQPPNVFIGIFDRDFRDTKSREFIDFEDKKMDILNREYIKLADNLFVFALPIPHDRKQGNEISIEHYFADDEIKTEHNDKRLFFHNEFDANGIHLDGTKRCLKAKSLNHNIKIISHSTKTKVTDLDGNGDYLLSKSIFANLVQEEKDAFAAFNFGEFERIFEVINKILGAK